MPVNRPSARELALVLVGFALLTAGMTFPLALHPGTLGYQVNYGDAQFSVWNVAWVARTLVVDPLHVLDANIFYPHRWTLSYSEMNLGAGALAAPVYWATRNVYTSHNFVVLLSFVLSATAMYYLARYLVADRRAAAVAAIAFAYTPHVFSHLPHIQLLMTAGLPLSLLAFHRLADRPSAARGAALGAAMAMQAFFCAYYSVFAMLMVGYAVLFTAAWRRLWRNAAYWRAIGVAAVAALAATVPLIAVYVVLQRATGFTRSVEAAGSYSADWRAYFASSAYAHAWMLGFLKNWREVLFPGFVALGFGLAGAATGWRAGGRPRELAAFYASLGSLAFWESFGPDLGLYRVTYAIVPIFSFMRAPSRFGLIVALALAVLTALAISRMLTRVSRPALAGSILALLTAAELFVPLQFMPAPAENPAYLHLASLPRGPVVEMPMYSERFAFARTRYMLSSTVHWMPLVDAYSDYIPDDFRARLDVLGEFPTREAFKLLERDGVRYAVFHVDQYSGAAAETLRARLAEFEPYLRRLEANDEVELYEITGFPR